MLFTLGVIASDVPFTVEHIGNFTFAGSNPTFSGIDFGTPDVDREIFFTYIFADPVSASGITIGGVTATPFTSSLLINTDITLKIGGFFATVPAGITGSIAMTVSTSLVRIKVYRVIRRPNIGVNEVSSVQSILSSSAIITLTRSMSTNTFALVAGYMGASQSGVITSTDRLIRADDEVSMWAGHSDPLDVADSISATFTRTSEPNVSNPALMIMWVFN